MGYDDNDDDDSGDDDDDDDDDELVTSAATTTLIHLTLKVLVATIDALGHFEKDNYSTVRGDGEVGSARYEPALLPPCQSIRVLRYSNCQRSSHSMSR